MNYRGLNAITVKYPLPLVPWAIEQLRGSTVFIRLAVCIEPPSVAGWQVVGPQNNRQKTTALSLKTPGLDYATFKWNQMTSTEFETERKKRLHFINLIQMLYYVEDPEATISFYRSLLHKDGKVIVILLAGESAWARLLQVFQGQLCKVGLSQDISTGKVKSFLDSKKITYQHYKFRSLLDITECFTPGDKKGELLLDLLTEMIEFSKTAPPELKNGILEFLKHPDNSQEVDGRILFDCSTEAVLIDA